MSAAEERRADDIATEIDHLCADLKPAFDGLVASASAREALTYLDTPVRRTNPGPTSNMPPTSPHFFGGHSHRDVDGIGTDSGARLYGHDRHTGAPIFSFDKNASMAQFLKERAATRPGMFRSVANPHLVAQIGPNIAGRWLEALWSGDWRGAEDIRAALGEGANSAGGFLVPEVAVAETIDLSRNIAVCKKLGAKTLIMLSETVGVCRIATDPTMRTKVENAAFTDENPTIDRINLTAKLFGATVASSNELMQDAAPNMATTLQDWLVRAHAQQLDRIVLRGAHDGDDDPLLGAFNKTGVQTIAAIGTPTNYDKMLDALEDLESVNAVTNGIVCGSAVRRRFRGLKQGDGTNSPLTYQAVHPDIAALPWLTSEQSESGAMYMGDWTKIVIGERLAPTVEFSRTADDAFRKYQTLFRIVWRGDVAVERADHLNKLSGIS